MTVKPISDGAPAKTTTTSLGVINALTRQWKFVSIISLLILAFALVFLLSDYRLFLLTMTLITAIAVLGLNILVGYNGQLSLGHGAIYAMGAYVTAVLMEHAGLAWWVTLPISAVVCFVFGFLFGWPAFIFTYINSEW